MVAKGSVEPVQTESSCVRPICSFARPHAVPVITSISGQCSDALSGHVSYPGLGSPLHDVPWAAQRWRVGQIEVAHLVHGQPSEDRRGGDVDPLGHLGVAVPEELDSQQLTGSTVAGIAGPNAMAAGVVRLVIVTLELDRRRIETP